LNCAALAQCLILLMVFVYSTAVLIVNDDLSWQGFMTFLPFLALTIHQ
jgi:hypothetical protein